MNDIEKDQLCSSAVGALCDATGNLSVFPGLLKKIIRERVWERRKIRTGEIVKLRNLHELITSKPLKGWGQDPKKVEAVIRDDAEALTMYREAMKKPEGGNKRSSTDDNIISDRSPVGTSRAYTLSRLQREAPDLFKRVCNKELSARAAGIAAGIVRVPSPIDTAKKAYARLDAAQRQEFKAWMKQQTH